MKFCIKKKSYKFDVSIFLKKNLGVILYFEFLFLVSNKYLTKKIKETRFETFFLAILELH
jgi:hypothetical protein